MNKLEKDVISVFGRHFNVPIARISEAYEKLKSFDTIYNLLEITTDNDPEVSKALDVVAKAMMKENKSNGKSKSKEA